MALDEFGNYIADVNVVAIPAPPHCGCLAQAETTTTTSSTTTPAPPHLPPEPSFWWDYSENVNMLDLVQGLQMFNPGNSVAGKIGNGMGLSTVYGNTGVSTTFTTDLGHLTGESFSASVWIKILTAIGPSENIIPILYRDNSAGIVTGLYFFMAGATPTVELAAQGTFQDVPLTLDLGNWHHFAIVYNGTGHTFKAYRDGVEIISFAKTIPASSPDWFLAFYKGFPDTSSFVFDEFGFWKGTALTVEDVAALYNSGAGLTWPFT